MKQAPSGQQVQPSGQPKPTMRLPDRPTIWHKLQLAFPWGAPTRLRKKPVRKPREKQAA